MSKLPIEYLRHIYDECEFINGSISADIKEQWRDIPWRNIAGMRDKLIHDYIGINYAIVWDVINAFARAQEEAHNERFEDADTAGQSYPPDAESQVHVNCREQCSRLQQLPRIK